MQIQTKYQKDQMKTSEFEKNVDERRTTECYTDCVSIGAKVHQPCKNKFHLTSKTNYSSPIASHYSDVIMNAMASPITGVSIFYSTVCSSADQRKQQSSVSLAFVRVIHRWPGDSPYKGQITRLLLSFDDVIMSNTLLLTIIGKPITNIHKISFTRRTF